MGHTGSFLNNVRVYAVRNDCCPSHGNDTRRQWGCARVKEDSLSEMERRFRCSQQGRGARRAQTSALRSPALDTADRHRLTNLSCLSYALITPQPHPHCAEGTFRQRLPDLPWRLHLTPCQPRARTRRVGAGLRIENRSSSSFQVRRGYLAGAGLAPELGQSVERAGRARVRRLRSRTSLFSPAHLISCFFLPAD